MTTTTTVAAQTIIDCARLGLGLGQALVKDIPAEKFARLITMDGAPIVANHPAYAYGHLAIYPTKVAGFLGGDAMRFAPPSNWPEIFEMNIECHDDPDGTIYPPKDEILAAFAFGYEGVLEVVAAAEDSKLAEPNPRVEMRERFPTIGMMCAFMLSSHVMFHLGQVSTWRRCNGLGSAM